MASFAKVEVIDFAYFPDQEDSLATGDQRLPSNLTAHNYSTDIPFVLDISQSGYTVKGLHPYVETASAASAVRFPGTPSGDAASFIRMRTFGGGSDFRAFPATRITTDGIGCYTAELIWVAGSPGAFRLEIVRYDATTGTRNVLASQTNAITEYPASSANFGNRFYAIGIQAIGSGASITLRAFLTLLYFTETPTLATYWDLNGMPASQTPFLSTTDATGSRHTSGVQGIKWASGTLLAASVSRIANQWGCFIDTASTKPTTPTISATAADNGQKLTVTISGFSDTDPLDSHQSTRWLLYEDTGIAATTFAYPLVDSGFSTGDLLSYEFVDLDPNQRYAVRVQVRDNDGDVSDFASAQSVDVTLASDEHVGFLGSYRFKGRVAGNQAPGNSGFVFTEPGAFSLSPVFKLVSKAAGASSAREYVSRFASVSAGQHRIFAWREAAFISGGLNPLYESVIATMVFIRWGHGSGVYIQTRSTAVDANCYYVKKQENGSNWEYLLYRRTLNSGGTAGPGPSAGPYTNTLLQTYSVPKTSLGSDYGERIILAHTRDTAGVGTLTLLVNGVPLSPVVTNEQQGGSDQGHQWHSVRVDDTNGTWGIYQIGSVAPVLSRVPIPAFVVLPEERSGEGLYHDPGPLMDPLDFGQNNIWYQSGGVWKVKSATATPGFLLYWAPWYTHYDTSCKAAIWGNNGVVSRFTDSSNYVAAFIGGSGGSRTLYLQAYAGGSLVLNVSDSISFVDGSEIILQTYNDPNSTDIFVRVFYNGDLILPATGDAEIITAGQTTALATGRCGIGRASALSSTTEDVASSFEVSEGITFIPPNTPTATGLASTACLKVSAVLQSSAFSDPDANTHAASQWQVIEYPAGSFSSPLWDSGEDASNLVTITVNTAIGTWSDPSDPGLDASTQYRYRVRHKDSAGLWSDWSDPVVFSTGTPSVTSPSTSVLYTFPTDPKPSQSFDESFETRVLVTPFEAGTEQRRAKATRGKRVFTLRYENLTASQMELFWSFYKDTAFGPLNVFLFVNPRTTETVLARFANGSMTRSLFEGVLERTGLQLVEVIL